MRALLTASGLLLVAAASAAAAAAPPAGAGPAFLKCLKPGTPAVGPSAPTYANLSTLNFRDDFARPLAIVMAQTAAHVSDAVKCARRSGLRVCARSGGHSFIGQSQCAGVIVDVGSMRSVAVHPDGVASIGPGATNGEVYWALGAKGRWFAGGNCPGVGMGGLLTGGGIGMFDGTLGIACDWLQSVTLVNRLGRTIVASQTSHSDLFWAMCGAGGGQFGIVTEFRLRTVPDHIYRRGVVFHVQWPARVAGTVVHRLLEWDEAGGKAWIRFEQAISENIDAYGACYDVNSTADCEKMLAAGAFWNVPGRNLTYISKVDSAVDLAGFFGPEGGWGRRRATNLRKAMLEQRYADRGLMNPRGHVSRFLARDARPPAAYWQKLIDFCSSPGLPSIPWQGCQVSLFSSAVNIPRNNAFPHREAHTNVHYILGGGTAAEKAAAYHFVDRHLEPHNVGVYVNYPEDELTDYAVAFWGKSLPRLRRIKKRYDPDLFFANSRAILPAA